jgi:hypothetical protein
MKASTFYNPLVGWLLSTPLHGLLSARTLLVTVTGRRSGQAYTVPTNYGWRGAPGAPDRRIVIVSRRERRWWRNLRGGAPVRLRVAGRNLAGRAEIEPADAAGVLAAIQTVYPWMPAEQAAGLAPDVVVITVQTAQPGNGRAESASSASSASSSA